MSPTISVCAEVVKAVVGEVGLAEEPWQTNLTVNKASWQEKVRDDPDNVVFTLHSRLLLVTMGYLYLMLPMILNHHQLKQVKLRETFKDFQSRVSNSDHIIW